MRVAPLSRGSRICSGSVEEGERKIVVGGLAKTRRRLSRRRKPFEYVQHEAGGLQQCDLRSVAGYKKAFAEQGGSGSVSSSLFYVCVKSPQPTQQDLTFSRQLLRPSVRDVQCRRIRFLATAALTRWGRHGNRQFSLGRRNDKQLPDKYQIDAQE